MAKKKSRINAYRRAAKNLHAEDGVLEIDDDAAVSLIGGDDGSGAYVQAWVWVGKDDLTDADEDDSETDV